MSQIIINMLYAVNAFIIFLIIINYIFNCGKRAGMAATIKILTNTGVITADKMKAVSENVCMHGKTL